MKTQFPTLNKTMHRPRKPLFGSSQALFRDTPRLVRAFGGPVAFIEFLDKIGYAAQVQAHLPLDLSSPNAIAPAHTLTAFVLAAGAGARRFAHTELLRADRALHTLLGLKRFPGHDTIRGLFLRSTQAEIEAFWRPLWGWLLRWVKPLASGFTVDLDWTIFQRAG
jgi:hypothetical protein